MKLGFIGLGRMGKAMVLRLLEQNVDVVVFNRSAQKTDELVKEYQVVSSKYKVASRIQKKKFHTTNYILHTTGSLTPTYSTSELVSKLERPRIIWIMVEHGKAVDEVIEKLISAGVSKDDVIIDGGNSFYKESIKHYRDLAKSGIHFLDVGTSGGLSGARTGSCMMVGGDEVVYKKVEPILKLAAMPGGAAYFGPSGAGHFVKMVHNGVEYGMLQSIGEGFEMLEKAPFELDLHKIAYNWTHGSVVRGWLMELLEKALRTDPRLSSIEGVVGGGSTGEWTIETARELQVETPVIEKSLEARKKSFAKPTFSGKVVAALRNQFGGHEVKKHIT